MIPVRLVLSNFLSYGEEPQVLDFTGFHVVCLTGANGNGKSALLDAITYALWGQGRKGRHERKADEGLLRLGARQLRVEFTFRLDDGCYRVLRTFRRRPKSGTTEVELQIHDPATDRYRSLSEAGATPRTQEQIDRLLAMDYETFVNSAFLAQGRADAFTRKGPRERKELLARILGLSRYDRLQERARLHQQRQQTELLVLRRRAQGLVVELEGCEQVSVALQAAEGALADVSAELRGAEGSLQVWQERRLRATPLHAELERCLDEVRSVEGRLSRLDAEADELDADCGRLQAQVRDADRIDSEVRDYERHCAEEAAWSERLEAARPLEGRVAVLQEEIATARRAVEQRRSLWVARREAFDERLARFDEVLGQAEWIESECAQVAHARTCLEDLRRRRDAWEVLDRQRQACVHEISLEEHQLVERRRGLEGRLHEVHGRIAAGTAAARQLEAAASDLESAAKQSEQMRALREEGALRRVQAEGLRERLAEVDGEEAQLQRRIESLSRGDLAQCPLCGTELDDDHRRRLDGELAGRHEELQARRSRLRLDLTQAERELADRRTRYRGLEVRAANLSCLQERVAALQAHSRRLDEDRSVLAQLAADREAIDRLLSEGRFALRQRAEVERIDAAQAELAVDASQLEAVEGRLVGAADVEARLRHLGDARVEHADVEARRQEADAEVRSAERDLASQAYAVSKRQALDEVQARLRTVGYDEVRHREVRARVAQLRDAPAARERVRAAEERLRAHADRRQQLVAERDEEQQRRSALEARGRDLRACLEDVADAETGCQQAQGRVAALRRRRDEVLERRGCLQARRAHLDGLAAEAAILDDSRQRLEREAWLHGQLAEAFGKDGIQALIIDSAIPEIEEETNAILRRLTDNHIRVAIESLRDLKGGGSRETLDVTIADELGERPYELYSGGEAFRTDFALRIALSKVLARRSGARLRTLIIDEGFGTQDARGLEQLREAIQLVSADFDKVLVVTHLEELKNAFPVRIEVTKDPDLGSRFEVVR